MRAPVILPLLFGLPALKSSIRPSAMPSGTPESMYGKSANPGVLFQGPVIARLPDMLSGVPLGIAEGLIDDFSSGSPNRSGRRTGGRSAEIQSNQTDPG